MSKIKIILFKTDMCKYGIRQFRGTKCYTNQYHLQAEKLQLQHDYIKLKNIP